jgi:signal transduction histidine kinase
MTDADKSPHREPDSRGQGLAPAEPAGPRRNGEATGGRPPPEEDSALRARMLELAHAREAVGAALRTKSQFLSNMSHEIRTPLNGVLGSAQLLLDTELTAEQKGYAETLLRSGENLSRLIDDLLDLAKIEAGGLVVEQTTLDVRAIVEETCARIAPAAEAKDLSVVCSVNPEVPALLLGSRRRLRQILLILLENAVKFTHEGGIAVEIRAGASARDRQELRVVVRDTGIGIPAEQLHRIFYPFTQADGSNSRKYEGAGLGLALVKGLAAIMGGTCEVSSDVGSGSTFRVTVPLGIPPKKGQ